MEIGMYTSSNIRRMTISYSEKKTKKLLVCFLLATNPYALATDSYYDYNDHI